MTSIVRFEAEEGTVSPAMLDAYRRDGFLIIDRFIPEETCRALVTRAEALIEAFDPSESRTVFDTSAQTHGADDYFRKSGDKIRFFYEPEAIDASGMLKVPKSRAINKIGHALHDLDPAFAALSRRTALRRLAFGIGLADPLLIQSMLILKQPRIGEEVGWHQDATYLYTEPLSATGFWIALEDARRDNGCLKAIPGGHRGPLRQRYRDRSGRLVLEELDPTPWPSTEAVEIEAPRGTLIVLHGLLPHASGANRTSRSRYAFALHAVERGAHYPAENWLQRSAMPARGFD